MTKANKALFRAVEDGDVEALKAALAAGAEVNTEDDDGYTSLHIASFEGHVEVVKKLLSVPGIDVNIKNALYETPLDIASYSGHEEIVKLLIDAGAEGYAENQQDNEENGDDSVWFEEEEDEDGEEEITVWEGEIRQMREYKMYLPGTLSKLLNVGEKDCLMYVCVCANESSNEWGSEEEYIGIVLKREGGAWKDICWPRFPHDDADPHFPENWNWNEILDQVWDWKTVTYTTKLNEDYDQVEATWEVEE